MSLLYLLIGFSSLAAAFASSDCGDPLFRLPLQDLIGSASLIIKGKIQNHSFNARTTVKTLCTMKGAAPRQIFVDGLDQYRLCTCCVQAGMEVILFLRAGEGNNVYAVNYQGLQGSHYETEIRDHLNLKMDQCLETQQDIKSPDTTPTHGRVDVCGQPHSQPDLSVPLATSGSFPWHAVVWFKKPGKKLCDGTLIHSNWLLTSAHCVDNVKPKQLKVGLGVRNHIVKKEDGRQISKVKSIRIHPRYRNTSSLYDIALLKLYPEEIKPTQFIQPICLTDITLRYDAICVVTSATNKGLEQSKVTITSPHNPKIDKFSFCAGLVQPDKEGFFSKFDSAPLVCRQSNGRWQQHGIASSEKGCTNPNYTIFSRLAFRKITKWITKATGNDLVVPTH